MLSCSYSVNESDVDAPMYFSLGRAIVGDRRLFDGGLMEMVGFVLMKGGAGIAWTEADGEVFNIV